jgi:hypothetical protein
MFGAGALKSRFTLSSGHGRAGSPCVVFLPFRECHELCVSGLAHAGFRYGHALKRLEFIALRLRQAIAITVLDRLLVDPAAQRIAAASKFL